MKEIPHSQPWIGTYEKKAVAAVLDTAMLSSGSVTRELEKYLAAYLNKKHALFTGNGSQAQILILMGMGIGLGDEVILPSYVCDKVYKAVSYTGATPVLADIGQGWLMEPEQVENLISPRTAAMILPHVYGLNAWNEAFLKWNIPVIEDVCQSLGHIIPERRTGTFTNHAFTSFHGTKPVGSGEGGMLLVNDESLYEKILKVRKGNPMFTLGTELAAAVALSQMQRHDETLRRRREIAEYYNENIPETLNADIRKHTETGMNFRYVLRTGKAFESVRQAFMAEGIHVRKGVDNLIHRDAGMPDEDFPNSTRAYLESVSIPLMPQLSDTEVQQIVETSCMLHQRGIL